MASVYGDAESFADMFSGYYTDVEPESGWVAVPETEPDRVVGYLLGCVDSRRVWDPAWVGVRRALLRGLLVRPSILGFYGRLLADVVRDRGVHRTRVDLARWPAHFHINLLPAARGGVGLRLHRAFVDHLLARGVAGIHAELVAENHRTLAIARKLGYAPLGTPFPIPGMRDAEGRRLSAQVVELDLRDPAAFRTMAAAPAHAGGAAR